MTGRGSPSREGAPGTGRAGRRAAPRPRAGGRRAASPGSPARAGAAAASRAPRRDAGRQELGLLPGDRGATARSFGDHAVDRARPRATSPNLVLTDNLGAAARARGLPVGQQAEGPGGAAAARRSPCARVRAHEAGQGRLRAGHVHQLGGRRDQPAARRRSSATRSRRPRGRSQRGAQARQGAGAREGASRTAAGKAAEQLVYAQFTRELLQLNLRYGLGLTAACRRSTTPTSSPRSCSTRRAARRRRRRASPTCSRTRTRRSIQVRLKPNLSDAAAPAGDRAGPQRGGDEGVAAQERRRATR